MGEIRQTWRKLPMHCTQSIDPSRIILFYVQIFSKNSRNGRHGSHLHPSILLEICHILSHFWTKGFKEVESRGETFCACLDSLNNFPCSFTKKISKFMCAYHFLARKRLEKHLNEGKLGKQVCKIIESHMRHVNYSKFIGKLCETQFPQV